MKITKSRLIQIIKEEVQAVVEQLPTNPLDAYGQSLTGGTAEIEGERTKLDRLEEPETQAILDIIGYLKEPKTIPVSTGPRAPEGKDLIHQYINLNKDEIEKIEVREKETPETKAYSEVTRILKEIGAAFRRDKGIEITKTMVWPNFENLLYRIQNTVLKRNRKSEVPDVILSLVNDVIETITNRVQHSGDASQGKYGIGGSLPLKNIEGGLS